MMKILWIPVAAVLLSACSQTVSEADIKKAGPRPDNYRQLAKQYLRETLIDPYSVRDAQISEPRVHQAFIGPLWNVCFKGNAKNRLGAYTGMDYTVLVFQNGRITVSDDKAYLSCNGATFTSFPELTAG